MQNIRIDEYHSKEPHTCTILWKLGDNVLHLGSFMLTGDLTLLQHFIGVPLNKIPGIPPIPPAYERLILTKISNISFIKEIQLVFEEKQ